MHYQVLLATLFTLSVPLMVNAQPLKDFVHGSRDGYRWTRRATEHFAGYSTHLLDLRSQCWRNEREVDRTEWQHWLTLVEPTEVTQETSFLYIASGTNDEPPPSTPAEFLVDLCRSTGSVVAELRMVPNQALLFTDEPNAAYKAKGRREDQLIAYTWDRFMTTGDPHWLASFAMIRAVVRAMDAIQEASDAEIKHFVVSGASKRGWTAWLAAAIDPRVSAVVPMVIDLLNIKESMEHHYRAYGFWSPALKDYLEMDIPQRWDTPQFEALLSLVDPYRFRHAVTAPKYLVNATGDQFFLPDSSRFYFDELSGDKWLRYVPNCDHRVVTADTTRSCAAFYRRLLVGEPLPEVSWRVDASGLLNVSCSEACQAILWKATNPDARDFRLKEVGPIWKPETLQEPFQIALEPPERGWRGYLVELRFLDGFVCTSDVFVIPDILPYHFAERRIS